MKFKSYLIFISLTFFSCYDIYIPSQSSINEHKLRVIGSTLETGPNISPGDTVQVKVVFAGNDVVDVYDWKILYGYMFEYKMGKKVRRTDYESVRIINSKNWLPDSIKVSILIDSNIIRDKADFVYSDEKNVLAIDSLVRANRKSGGKIFENMKDDEIELLEEKLFNIILDGNLVFKARSENGSNLEIKKTLPITYRKEFPGLLEESFNPQVKWIVVYGMPGDELDFIDFSSIDSNTNVTKNYLYNKEYPDSVNDKIIIQDNWSYILVADTSFVSSLDLDHHMNFDWFYQPVINGQNSNNSHEDEFDMYGWYTSFIPSEKKKVQSFHLWLNSGLTVNNIKGHSIIHCEGTFEYQ